MCKTTSAQRECMGQLGTTKKSPITQTTLCLCHRKPLTSYGYLQSYDYFTPFPIQVSRITFNITTLDNFNIAERTGITAQDIDIQYPSEPSKKTKSLKQSCSMLAKRCSRNVTCLRTPPPLPSLATLE